MFCYVYFFIPEKTPILNKYLKIFDTDYWMNVVWQINYWSKLSCLLHLIDSFSGYSVLWWSIKICLKPSGDIFRFPYCALCTFLHIPEQTLTLKQVPSHPIVVYKLTSYLCTWNQNFILKQSQPFYQNSFTVQCAKGKFG